MFLRLCVCELNTEAKIVFDTEVVGYICSDNKHFNHASCSNIRLEKIWMSAPERGNWKEQGVLIIFHFYLNLLFRNIENPIGSFNYLSFILGRSGENGKLRAISFSVSLWTGKVRKVADLLLSLPSWNLKLKNSQTVKV